jgi:chemotaxis protein methyltransferase CheR
LNADLDAIVRLVAERTGMRFGHRQHPWLWAAVARVAERIGDTHAQNDIALLARRDDFVEQLIDEVTIRETFFMRQFEQLRSIDWHLALDTAHTAGRATIRVWSAGCASGEEAYTLAMLAVDSLGPTAPVSVVGTDLSSEALACARRGWYTGRTVRRLDPDVLARHFRPEEGGISVQPSLRRLVDFRRHNLVHDPSPPAGEDSFDVVVCRNVLIHFEPQAADRAGAGLLAGLRPGGTLLLAPADRLCLSVPALGAMARGRETHAGDRPVVAVTRRTRRSRRSRPGRKAPPPASPTRRTPPRDLPDHEGRPSGPLAEAMRLADADRVGEALVLARRATSEDPLDASAHLIAGILEIAAGVPEQAVGSLRRSVYIDPSAAIAAFHLGRAREAAGEWAAARQAYEHALHALDPEDRRFDWLLDPLDVADVAEACKLRLLDLRARR